MYVQYYDPMFYICSEKMPFTIRIEVTLKDPVEPEALVYAMHTAIRRYPYFSVQVEERGEELIAVPNDRPITVYPGPEVRPLGGDGVGRHLLAASYEGNTVNFFVSHVITDGGGFFPFLKTALYYYLCRRHRITLDPAGIRLIDVPVYDDEVGNPYPEDRMLTATALYRMPTRPFFRLCDGGHVRDERRTVFRFRVREADMMRFNRDHDGSPCALLSALMTQAIWTVHPEVTDDIVSAVSFNLRPALGNQHSYRMLSSAIFLRYPNRLRGADTAKLCTCSRGMVTLQSQPENVLYYAEQRRRHMESLQPLSLAEKKEIIGHMALEDALNNTFSVSYVGRVGLGSLEPYLDSIYNLTDGSTWQTVFLEVAAVGGWFHIAFLQGFSSDVYYRALLDQLTRHGLPYEENGCMPIGTPDMILP